jgi:AcrR family transcriptional regulator
MGDRPLGKCGNPRNNRRDVTVPTGVPVRNARDQLFVAAERVLLRDGPSGLTSRSVTTEACVAKGVLHRHFAGFDAFLAELVLDRVEHVGRQAAALQDSAGTGSVVDNLTGALTVLFGSVALEIIGLLMSRNELRAQLSEAGAGHLPVIRQGTAMIANYLLAERDLGRTAADVDVAGLAPTLMGAGHLLFAGREGVPPGTDEVRKIVTSVLSGVLE